jgi:hypothetical protein
MNYIPSRERTFLYRIDISTFYATYLRWFRHLSERLGTENTLLVWKSTFADYDDEHLLGILSLDWYQVEPNESNRVADKIGSLVYEIISITNLGLSESEVRSIIENTPPIFQIKRYFSTDTVETEISAYDALHLRFDGLAYLAEAIIEAYGKQGELVIYDLMVEDRLANSQGKKGSIEQFIANFTAQPDKPNLFTAGLEIERISEMPREIVINVRECEWARYFRERHPKVGYLMACSTDEVAYKSYNEHIQMQRTQTIMEGAEKCDFRIYAVRDSV